jgi:DNA-binding NarL/FixJ family response regulator
VRVAVVEACLLQGALDRADAMVAAGFRDQSRQRINGLAGQWALVRARAALIRGRFGEAIEYFREGSMLLERNLTLLGRSGVVECHAGLALGYAFQGDLAAAAVALTTAESTAVQDCFSPTLALARAWIPALSGDRQAGLAAALDAVAANVELGNAGFEAAALHLAALLGAEPSVADRLVELADQHPAPLRQALAEHAVGVVKHDGAVLDRAALAFANMGAYPFAAQAAADAGNAHAAAGHRSDAVLASERSRAHLARCAGYRPLETLGAPDVPALTRREREVAELAAAGLANADIARRLVLSIRTVETHLSNVYTKLGQSGRTRLQELFPEA